MRPYAVVRPVAGLANRLLGVTSTLALARKNRFRFAMLWEPGVHFSDDAWPDLFANDFELWSRARYEGAIDEGVPLSTGWKEISPRESREVARAVRERGLVFDRASMPINEIMKTGAMRRLRPSGRASMRACRELRPAPSIAREIDAFASASSFRDGDVVGVHIRRGDAVIGPHREQYLPSTDGAFEHALREILRKRPHTRFFLATDCATTQQRFQGLFPDRILTREKPFVASERGAPKAGQRDAVADLFLLSRTRRIVGTRWSTFGPMAARIGGVRIETAEACREQPA